METPAERHARRADTRTQEQAPADHRVGRTARDFLHTIHPDTGQDVVFTPGELLPVWVAMDEEGDL